jgi:hypothetical protein
MWYSRLYPVLCPQIKDDYVSQNQALASSKFSLGSNGWINNFPAPDCRTYFINMDKKKGGRLYSQTASIYLGKSQLFENWIVVAIV